MVHSPIKDQEIVNSGEMAELINYDRFIILTKITDHNKKNLIFIIRRYNTNASYLV